METLTLNIDGMSCNHCVMRVTRTLAALPGVEVEQVTIGAASVRVDPARIGAPQIVAALGDAGYEARPAA